MLDSIMEQKIRDEIEKDPEKRGYSGKTNQQIANLLNKPYYKDVVIQQEYPPRLYTILYTIPSVPNIVIASDIESLLVKEVAI